MKVSRRKTPGRRGIWSRRAVVCVLLFSTLMGIARAERAYDLIDRLRSADAVERARAAEKLGYLNDRLAVPELTRLMDDPAVQVRFSAIKALGQLHARAQSRAIAERLKDESPLIRMASAEALSRLGDPQTIPALTAALQDHNSYVRLHTARALGNLKARAAEPALQALCADPDPDVRIAGIQALVKMRSPAAVQHIEPLLKDADEGVRATARRALRDLRTIWAHIGLVLLAILPALFMLQRYHRLDWLEPEPTVKVYEAFSLGVASAGLASWLNFLMDQAFPLMKLAHHIGSGQSPAAALLAAASVGVIEEGCKFLVMSVFIWRWPDFDQRFDGILYAAAVGLGFAAYENLYYVLESGIHVGIMRALLSVPVHATCGILMGYFFGLAKWRQLKWPAYPKRLLFYGYAAAVLFHAIWDAIGLQKEIVAAFLFLVITLFAVWLRRKVMRQFFEKA